MICSENRDRSLEEAVKGEISARLTEHQFETWFRKLELVFESPERVSIVVPNNFYQQYLRSRFLPVIYEAVEAVTHSPRVEVEFHLAEHGDGADAAEGATQRETMTQVEVETAAPPRASEEALWRKRNWDAPRAPGSNGPSSYRSQDRDLPESPAATTEARPGPVGPALERPVRDNSGVGDPQAIPSPAAGHNSLPDNIPLNGDYTFDNFVTGHSNRLAHAACLAVAQNPGKSYNPLFLYGQVGLGKTHLLQAVCHTFHQKFRQRTVYLSCASFTNDFISAVSNNDLDRFRSKYRDADAILIDDIQFLANKERTQEEFFHTFNAIYNQQKQILLTSDCLPSEIAGLSERLVSRFKLGLVAQLNPPSYETRVAIVLRKAKNLGMDVPEDVAEFVAHRIRTNVREIEGAVLRLHTLVTIEKKALTIDESRGALSDLIGKEERRISLLDIQKGVLEEFSDVRPADLHSRKRTRSIVVPRQICMYIARVHTDLSLGEIGMYFGGRDHSTVLHSIDRIREQMQKHMRIRNAVGAIERRLGL
ncbi:MAG: chromosomal replication initiator protein DnaA [Planctomycetota bacterium]